MDSRDEPEESELKKEGDYLWDRSGKPEGDIQKVEMLLTKFRYDRPLPAFPNVAPKKRWAFFARPIWLVPALSAAAVIAVIAATILIRGKSAPQIADGWDISNIKGAPQIGTSQIADKTGKRLAVGQVLETDRNSRAELRSENVGRIEVEANTRLRLLSMGNNSKRIALDHGTIQAYIWAPPAQFVVDTPSATTVDLGCAYTLTVDNSGAGIVRTSIGWVGFKLNGHEAFIPAGAACSTRPKVGPGTPYFEDASENFKAALARFDFQDRTSEQRAQDLAIVLREVRQRDVLTLWHLLSRVDENQREMVFDHLSKFVPPPAGVTRDGILRLDQGMLDLWWNNLGFDDISVWRHWERSSITNAPDGMQ